MTDSDGGTSRQNNSQSVLQSEPDDPGSQQGSDAAEEADLRHPAGIGDPGVAVAIPHIVCRQVGS